MDHKALGQTTFTVPEIGLGTWQYQGGRELLRRGVELGACLIDTAEVYGTEQVVGEAVRPIRNAAFIATKVSASHFRRSDLLKAADASLQRLRTDHIDLYQLHWPNPAVPIAETMAAMEELVDLGKVRFIGVCNFSVAQLKEAQSTLAKQRIVSNQVPYSLVNRGIEFSILPYCQENGITVIAYSPLARGLHHIRRKDRRGILTEITTATGKSEAQVALNWCISKAGVVAIPKANSAQHLVENCGASGWRLAAGQMQLLDGGFRRRGPLELVLRRVAGRALKSLGLMER